jgi:hypothetical protein
MERFIFWPSIVVESSSLTTTFGFPVSIRDHMNLWRGARLKSCKNCMYYRGWKIFLYRPHVHRGICSDWALIATWKRTILLHQTMYWNGLGTFVGLYRNENTCAEKCAKK